MFVFRRIPAEVMLAISLILASLLMELMSKEIYSPWGPHRMVSERQLYFPLLLGPSIGYLPNCG